MTRAERLTFAAWFGGIVASIVLLSISVDLFLVAAIIALAIWLCGVYEQRDEAANDAAGFQFELAHEKHLGAQLASDYDVVVRRLAEVLDEHALCPSPIRVEIAAVDEFTERMVGAARAAAAIPAQRDGDQS